MKLRLLMCLLEAVTFLVVVYFEPTHCVRGKLHGEAFFDGKPTSWWRTELAHWEVLELNITVPWHQHRETSSYIFFRNPSWFEQWRARRWGEELDFLQVRPLLLRGDEAAVPVLCELFDDPSPKIRHFVRIGLKMDPKEEN